MSAELEHSLDDDLTLMSREALVGEVTKLRAGIRQHRSASGHDLCWHHPKLWGLLPEKYVPELSTIPERHEFLRRCEAYRLDLERKVKVDEPLG